MSLSCNGKMFANKWPSHVDLQAFDKCFGWIYDFFLLFIGFVICILSSKQFKLSYTVDK